MNAVGKTLHGVLGFWHGLAAVQNVFDILASTGVAPALRPLASKNTALMRKLLERIHPSQSTLAGLLAVVSVTEAVASVAFLRGAIDDEPSDFGFALSLALFGSFFLLDDAFDGYDLGADHRAIFTLLAAAYAASKIARA
jgi:hypothetical protein